MNTAPTNQPCPDVEKEEQRVKGLLITLFLLTFYILIFWLFTFRLYLHEATQNYRMVIPNADAFISFSSYKIYTAIITCALAANVILNLIMILPWEDSPFEYFHTIQNKIENLTIKVKSRILTFLSFLTIIFVFAAVFLTGGSSSSPFSHMMVSLGAVGVVLARSPRVKYSIFFASAIGLSFFSFIFIDLSPLDKKAETIVIICQVANGVISMLIGIVSAKTTGAKDTTE